MEFMGSSRFLHKVQIIVILFHIALGNGQSLIYISWVILFLAALTRGWLMRGEMDYLIRCLFYTGLAAGLTMR